MLGKKKGKLTGILAAAMLTVGVAGGAIAGEGKCPETLTLSEAKKLLGNPSVNILSVKPVGGYLFEVLGQKGEQKGTMYIDCSKKFVLQGAVFDVETKERVLLHAKDLPEQAGPVQKINIGEAPKNAAMVLGNAKSKNKLYVFTDPDCPFCRQLHPVLKQLASEYDVAVNIMLMPIPSLHPAAFDKSVAVFASKDFAALDNIFEGKEAPDNTSEDAKDKITAIMNFANKAGINGTPSMFDKDGKAVNSRDVAGIAQILGAPKKK
ncbi:MAG: DsbC family protein [Trichlorobacter sp.]|nr:DsbC family protein [Trichlorobacter sp.]